LEFFEMFRRNVLTVMAFAVITLGGISWIGGRRTFAEGGA